MSKNNSVSFYSTSKKHLKHLVIFIWLSFSLHLYIFWGTFIYQDIGINNISSQQKKQILHNIILETKEQSQLQEEEAYISDKNNISKSLKSDKTKEKQYNIANPNEANALGYGGKEDSIPQKENTDQNKEKQEYVKVQNNGITIEKQQEAQKKETIGGGETAPTLYDVKKRPIINLYNTGTLSLATKSKEYSQYFINMKNKIEKYHKEFFPIYQYYQGLLKDGEVVVEYVLNKQGDIVDAKVVTSYGSDTIDNASLNSIVYARNFGIFPKDLQNEEEILIRFHFIYISR